MKLVAGREYDREFPTDAKEAIIVNEALVKKLGIEDPVGKTIKYSGSRDGTIIGVVQNFHFRSLHHEVEPAILPLGTNTGRLLVRIHPENVPGTIAFIKEQWEKLAPNHAFNFSFIDEDLGQTIQKRRALEPNDPIRHRVRHLHRRTRRIWTGSIGYNADAPKKSAFAKS